MRRRQFLKVFGGAAVAGPAAGWPWVAGAQQQQQQQAMPRIGVLMGVRNGDSEGRRWAFRFIQILREHGWRNGTNVQIEMRWAVEVEKIRAQAQELVDLKPDVIHVTTAIATAEVLRRTSTIPVVFSMVNDPVTLGFVKNTEKPDGNATGFTNISPTLVKNWLGLLEEISPKISRIAVLFNPVPGSILEQRWDQFEAAAASLGVTVERTAVRNIAELEKAVEFFGTGPRCRDHFDPRSLFQSGPQRRHHLDHESPSCRDPLSIPRLRPGRRARLVLGQLHPAGAAFGGVCRPHLEGSPAGRSARAAPREIRGRH
jgi:putative ABC transport system substrate-binding protein